MPISIQIDQSGSLQQTLVAHRNLVRSSEARNVVGFAGAQAWREHLYKKDAQGNRLGGRRTHYWAKAADSVHHRTQAGGQVVIAAQQVGLLQRFKGGTITAKNAKLLTVPVHPAAHGRRAREIGGLSLIKSGRGQSAKLMLAKTRKGTPYLEVFYILKRSVTQRSDPSVVNEPEILAAGLRGLRSLINARLRSAT